MEDIVVIGGGLMGSSSAWELSQKGENVVLIEQQDERYDYGSSLGEARIARSLGPQNDIFSYLHNTSVLETEKLIHYLNEFDEQSSHKMEDVYTTSAVTYIYYQSQLEELNNLLDGQSDKFEFAANPDEAQELFDMAIPDSAKVVREHKKHSGTLNPSALISKLHRGIKLKGNQVIYNEKITALKRTDKGFEIRMTNSMTGIHSVFCSKKVIVATGAFTGRLLKNLAPYFEQLIQPKRNFLVFIKLAKTTYDNFSNEQKKRFPDFYPVADFEPEFIYSMIENYDEDDMPLLKIGGHFIREDYDDVDTVWQKELSEDEIAWGKEKMLKYLRILKLPVQLSDLHFVKGYSCVYSLTETEIPFVTNILGDDKQMDPNLVLVGGMSGIGAKGSMAYGMLAADLIKNDNDPSAMYQKTKNALGFDRLLEDLQHLNE